MYYLVRGAVTCRKDAGEGPESIFQVFCLPTAYDTYSLLYYQLKKRNEICKSIRTKAFYKLKTLRIQLLTSQQQQKINLNIRKQTKWNYLGDNLSILVQFYNFHHISSSIYNFLIRFIYSWIKMKGYGQSNEEFIKQEQSEHFKYQQYSSQNHNDFPNKTGINFQSMQKPVFYELTQKMKSFSKSILIRLLDPEKKFKNQKIYLQRYLASIQEKTINVQSYVFSKAVKDFRRVFLEQVRYIWQNQSEQKRCLFQQIGKRNCKMVKYLERKEQVFVQRFSGFQMLKIDVLCVAFRFNKYYFAGLNNSRKLISYYLLQKIFDIDQKRIGQMARMYKRVQKNIHLDYQQYFHEYYELLYYMRLGYKFGNFSKREGKEALESIPLVYNKFGGDFKQQVYSNNPKFRFCQIAYESNIEKLKQQIQQKQNQKDIKIEYEKKIQEQYWSKLQQNLYKCQWVFLNGPYILIEGINSACQINNSTYWTKYRQNVLLALYKLTIQRFNTLPTIFKMQQQLDPKLHIFIYKLQYSLREIGEIQKQLKPGDMEQQVEDLKCSLVLLVANQQILAYSICRNALSQNCYMGIVKLCLKLKVVHYAKMFNIVLYGFDYRNHIDWQTFIQFQVYMNKNYDARVYMLNDPSLFQPHFLIHAFIKSYLLELNLNSSNFYEYVQVCINHLLKEIEFFDKKTNEQYFVYFTKIMRLQLKLKDMWKCFKKDRENKYNAVIFGRQQIEEQRPHNFRIFLKATMPTQQWFLQIQYCEPSFDKFTQYKNRQKWRRIQLFQQFQDDAFLEFLRRKHIKERQIKRILRDVARCFIDYHIFFKELIDKKQELKDQNNEILSFLLTFYQSQEKNIDTVFSISQRQAILSQFTKKYDKTIKVSDFCKKGNRQELKIKIQSYND